MDAKQPDKEATDRWYKLRADVACRRDLPITAKLILAVIADRIGDNGVCWPGIRSLARDTGTDAKTAMRAVHALEAAGELVVEHRHSGRGNRYRLPEKSAPKKGALPKPERSQNRSAPKMGTERSQNGSASAPILGTEPERTITRPKKGARRQKRPPDPRVREFIDFFSAAYEAALGRKYIVAGPRDGGLVKNLLQRLDGAVADPLGELKRATRNMLADDWGRCAAEISLLSSQLNKWRGNAGERHASTRSGSFHNGGEPAADYDRYATEYT